MTAERFNQLPRLADDLPMPLPPFTFHPTTIHNAPQKPVILLLPTGGVCEFNSLDNAQSYLNNALRVGAPGANEAALFSFDFKDGEWKRVV
ncbi:MAG TPA: hypothetical protein VFP96_05885 [Candidatus Acidoferrum sp.]|nr:hypothetical protein [Candidatus Acidoferrum sp.]